MRIEMDVPKELARLFAAFERAGHSLWFVGGINRDRLRGEHCKDVDLATSADPRQQIGIYAREEMRWIDTGMHHGTVTVMLEGTPYEVTSCRTETDHDGRHAVVEYTTDIIEDLRRRDLTINAIASTLDGTVIDPFGGVDDIVNRRVRFVGDAVRRIREDHLRILRWFRFLARMGDVDNPDPDAVEAIRMNADSLAALSVERIWMEMSRIVTGPHAASVLDMMRVLGVTKSMGIENVDTAALDAAREVTTDAATVMAACVGGQAADLAARWKWSREESRSAACIASAHAVDRYGTVEAKADLIDGRPRHAVLAALAMRGDPDAAAIISAWTMAVFPVKGADLISMGMVQGVEVGRMMNDLKKVWAASGHEISAGDLLAIARRQMVG